MPRHRSGVLLVLAFAAAAVASRDATTAAVISVPHSAVTGRAVVRSRPVRAELERPPAVVPGQPGQDPVPPVTLVEVVAVDRDGKAVVDLGPSDFSVTVDRQPRRVLWVRHVSRGPGATSEAAARQPRAGADVIHAAEPVRSVLLVVDQATLARGRERAVIQAAGALLDRLGLDDRVAVIRIPVPSESRVTLTTERPEARETLRLVVGQASPVAIAATDLSLRDDPDRTGVVDPDRVVDPERPPVVERPPDPLEPGRPAEDPGGPGQGTLAGVIDLLHALQAVPGRKVIALFSAGIVGGAPAQLDEAAAAAAAAHAVVHAFALDGGGEQTPVSPDPVALERLARLTGGSFVAIGRNPDRSIDRVLPVLSSCYVLGLEADPADQDGRRRSLRVEVGRARVTVQAQAWLMPVADAGDVVPAPPAPPAAEPLPLPAAGARAGPEPARSARAEAAAAERAAREAELALALARLAEYVNGYQRQYSALVAEEEYWQNDRGNRRTLQSDLLLVRPVNAQEDWVSFRDVFAVDGVLVRDREDRLRRLFLEASPEADAQLLAIKTESARYNIGQVVRNINIPFFALNFLRDGIRERFDFRLSGRQDAGGIETWRIEYAERERPTLVRQNDDKDLPARGWFLVDPQTGAVVESRMELMLTDVRAEFVVRYRRDATLGLWVPAEMQEIYQIPATTVLPPNFGYRAPETRWTTLTEARATYSKFRRFQVKTEERITIPK